MNLQYLGTIAGFLEFTNRLALQTEKKFRVQVQRLFEGTISNEYFYLVGYNAA